MRLGFMSSLQVSVSEATAVLTGVARLPCDLNPSAPGDKVALVIWYKDGAKSPIYSLDVRGRSLDQATHWADERTLGGRAFFRVGDEPEVGSAHLAVESVREVDGGSYRCRVDFKNSPTRNAIVNLTIIDKGCFRSFEIFWDQYARLYFDTHKEEQDISGLNFTDVSTPTRLSITGTTKRQPFPSTLQRKVHQQQRRRHISPSSDSDTSGYLDEPSNPSDDFDPYEIDDSEDPE
uniref:Ig-like domain-containing protein n=1 Tax=Timema poppense TaxID=170557 RepID=A0A7R9CL86_TIMPO|nr:unnamed protein product [Timema poppensis]